MTTLPTYQIPFEETECSSMDSNKARKRPPDSSEHSMGQLDHLTLRIWCDDEARDAYQAFY